jgi:hypothetical protein
MSEDLRESQARDQECIVVFEKHPHADAYKYGGSFTPYAIVGVDKRFSDSELAAEYWRLRLKVCVSGNSDMKTKGHVCVHWQAAHDELDIMQRFMELPHYDD